MLLQNIYRVKWMNIINVFKSEFEIERNKLMYASACLSCLPQPYWRPRNCLWSSKGEYPSMLLLFYVLIDTHHPTGQWWRGERLPAATSFFACLPHFRNARPSRISTRTKPPVETAATSGIGGANEACGGPRQMITVSKSEPLPSIYLHAWCWAWSNGCVPFFSCVSRFWDSFSLQTAHFSSYTESTLLPTANLILNYILHTQSSRRLDIETCDKKYN